MNMGKGALNWYIPDGFIPPVSKGELLSHESICVLNCGDEDAQILVTVYYEDQAPLEKVPAVCPAKRTKHIRTSSLIKDGVGIPVGDPYAMEVESNVPVIVQYSRLDSTQAENSLMTTMAYPL